MGETMDYSKLTDEQFNEHCEALYAEQDRRAKLRDLPDEIKSRADEYEALGGDKADLIIKINEEKPSEPTNDAPVSIEPTEPSGDSL